jgi:hypothetical protein
MKLRKILSILIALGFGIPTTTGGEPRIINGKPTGEGFPQVAAIGFQFNRDQVSALGSLAQSAGFVQFGFDSDTFTSICSGTLIGDRTVVSAAHCVAKLNSLPTPQEFAEFLGVSLETVFFVQLGGTLWGISEISIHPDFNPSADVLSDSIVAQCGTLCKDFLEIQQALGAPPVRLVRNDISVLTLRNPVEDIVPFSLTRREPRVGKDIVIAGYGVTNAEDPAGLPDPTDPERSVEGVNFVGAFDRNSIYFFFDDPEDVDSCFGDSGGPLFTDYGSGAVLIGIVSGGTNDDCWIGDIAWNERVDIHVDWIDAVSAGNVYQILN